MRRAFPRAWLLSDARAGDPAAALAAAPRGTGLVLRHHGAPGRGALVRAGVSAARRLGAAVLVAGPVRAARAAHADGAYRPAHHRAGGTGFVAASAHSIAELRRAERAGARLVFVGPVFATRSHPGAAPLGRVRFGLIARAARVPVAALGGMDARRFRGLRALGATAWGAIDAFSPRAARYRP